MTASAQRIAFSEERPLTLTGDKASVIWCKIRSKTLFASIEWGCLSSDLVDKHSSLFTRDELDKLSDGKPCCKEAVNSAMNRAPQNVLNAFYKSLLDTQHCGGATQHAVIAEEIKKETRFYVQRSVSEPKLAVTEAIAMRRPDHVLPHPSSSLPGQTFPGSFDEALLMCQTTSSSMEDLVTDSDIQQKLTRSCLEELSSRMDRESSLHAKRVDELEQQLKKMTSHMQAELSSLKERIADLEQQSKKASSQSEEMSSCLQVFQTTPLLRKGHTLRSEKLPDLPLDTACVTAVYIEGKVYVCGGRCRDAESGCLVHVYNFDEKKWSTLPTPAPQYRCEAIAFNNQLVLMGGREASSFKITNIINTWTGDCWQNELPAMPVNRLRPGIILYRKYIIAAGGMSEHNRALLSSIDILDTETRQWWTPANFQLPKPMYALSVTTSSSYLYVAAAIVDYDITNNLKTPSNEAWQLPVDVLEDVLTTKGNNERHHWTVIAPTPYNHSTLLKGNTHPLAVGGAMKGNQSGSNATCHICAYDHVRNQWSSVGQLQEPRARCAVVCVNESSFLVCGGYSDTAKDPQPRISSVELLTVHR